MRDSFQALADMRCGKRLGACNFPEGHTGSCEKLYSQAEVDALVAAERALFAQKAAEHQPMVAVEERVRVRPRVWIYCSCGFNRDGNTLDPNDWTAHLLALADPNAIVEHDAALREQWLNAKMGCGHVQRYRTGPQGMTDDQWAKAECDECVACENAKLEAENAELRLRIVEEAKWWANHDVEDYDTQSQWDELAAERIAELERALLAKSGAPK